MSIIRWTSVGMEAVFGTAVAGKYFVDPIRVSLEAPNSPFLFYPGASGRGDRVIVPAGYIPKGDIESALDQFRNGVFLRGLVPGVNYQQHGIAKAGQATTIDVAGVVAGDTTIPVAASAGFEVDDIIQIGADLTNSEVHKITAVRVGPDELDIEDVNGLTFDHASAIVIDELTSLQYIHTFDIGGTVNVLDSMTVRVAKDTDEQIFAGAAVNSIRLSADHNSLLNLVANIVASKDSIGAVPSSPAGGIFSQPFASSQLTVADLDDLVSGSVDILPNIRAMDLSLSNNVVDEDGMRMGSRFPTEFRGLGITAGLTLQTVFRDRLQFNDFYGQVTTPSDDTVTGRDVHLQYTQDAENIVDLFLYNGYPVTVGVPTQGRDQFIQSIEFRSIQPLETDDMCRIQLRTQGEFRYY